MNEKSENKARENNVMSIIFCIVSFLFTVIILIAVGICLYAYIKEQNTEKSTIPYNYSHTIHLNMDTRKTSLEDWHRALVDSIYISTNWSSSYFHPSVSVNIDTVHVTYPLELDSLSQCLSKIDRLYKEYYNDALNDLRQESNNIINKWSGWLGFWISVLALLMGILPIAIQFKLSNRSEKRIEQELQRLENQILSKEKELETLYKNKEDELEKQYQDKEHKLKEQYQKFEQKLNEKSQIVDENLHNQEMGRLKSKVVNAINAIDLSKNNKLLQDSQKRMLLLRKLLLDLRKQFSEFIKINEKIDVCKNEDKYNDLLVVLIEIHGVVTKLIPFLHDKSISRRINGFQKDLQDLILKIAHNYSTVNYSEIDRIRKNFDQLVDELR